MIMLSYPSSLRRMVFVTVAVGLLGACQTAKPELEPAPPPPPTLSEETRLLLLAEGEIALEEGEAKQAMNYYHQILRARPDDPDARLGVIETYVATGNWKEAFKQLRTLEPTPAIEARYLQAEGATLVQAGRAGEARQKLAAAVRIDETLWRAWNLLGFVEDRSGNGETARESYRKALAANPDAVIVYNNLGVSYMTDRLYSQAEEILVRGLMIAPDNDTVKSNLRLAIAFQGRYVDALAGAKPKELPEILNNIGYIATIRGDYVDAESYLARALALSPTFNEEASRNLRYLGELKQKRELEQQRM